MTIKKILKYPIYLALSCLPAVLTANRANVLMYHSISDDGLFFCVKPDVFRKQMTYLATHRFNVVSLDKLFEYFLSKNIPPKTIVLTFDDGYEDNYKMAFPVLREHNLPATIFLTTGWIGSADNKVKKKIMDLDQIRELHDSGLIDFQPHTLHHFKLSGLDPERQQEEIIQSKEFIDDLLKKNCRYFAYPHGRYTETTISILQTGNFQLALTTKGGLVNPSSDRFQLKRNAIDSQVNTMQFKGIVKFARF